MEHEAQMPTQIPQNIPMGADPKCSLSTGKQLG